MNEGNLNRNVTASQDFCKPLFLNKFKEMSSERPIKTQKDLPKEKGLSTKYGADTGSSFCGG